MFDFEQKMTANEGWHGNSASDIERDFHLAPQNYLCGNRGSVHLKNGVQKKYTFSTSAITFIQILLAAISEAFELLLLMIVVTVRYPLFHRFLSLFFTKSGQQPRHLHVSLLAFTICLLGSPMSEALLTHQSLAGLI